MSERDAPPAALKDIGLVRHPEPLALVHLPAGADVPDWVGGGTIVSVTATERATSILCSALVVPAKAEHRGPFVAFVLDRPLDPSHVGLLSELAAPLARASISLLPIATYDEGWVLVHRADAARVARLWTDAGFEIQEATS